MFYYNTLKKIKRSRESFYNIAHVFNIWLRQQQGYHICLYIPSVASHLYVHGKRRSILKGFLDNCGYSVLLLQQSLTSCGFLKVNCNVESEFDQCTFFTLLH